MLVSMDSIAKELVKTHSVVQVVWGRYFFQVAVLAVILFPRLRRLMVTPNLGLQLVRSLLLLVTTGLYFTGLKYVPIAEASAIMYSAPLLVTALAPFILKEKVGLRRWMSVLIGFVGALIIIRPGHSAIGVGAFWMLGAAASYACYQLCTRALSHQDSALTTLFYSALLGAIIMSAIVPFHFQTPDMWGWFVMFLAGLFGTVGHYCMIQAFTNAEASAVAPYTYSNLIWATVIGFFFFGNLPDMWTYVGAAIIIASGLYIMHRENIKTQ